MARIAIFTERYTIRNSLELTALTNFRMAAFELGHELDFLFKTELKYLTRYDAVFIRALTDPLNSSYVAARMAEMHGMRVLDQSESIRICCDKINMYARLQAHKVAMPETCFMRETELNEHNAEKLFEEMGSPLVLKAPNSSFSAYVDKVSTPETFVQVGKRFLRRADRLVVQQYMPSSFDWRVVTLNGQILAVIKYVFAQDKWRLMDRTEEGEWAKVIGIPKEEANPKLIETALAAANAIGKSLYGIDVKEVEGEFYIIEVNDNPTIAAGEEDQANPEIYEQIIRYLAGEDGIL
ncbi:MAG: RimK family alpha-L-glutamate ligase [Trueperaceae bacterium]|nr:RimK family alpha-L-glutamate ligase [Trueperaceae bacterium]